MKRIDNLKWDKLDNTAILFPVIAKEGTTNVYRISVVLKEEIQENLLQQSLNEVLPYFDVFRNRMKMGIFWYYFETNRKKPPTVQKECTYPCQYINPNLNRDYLFRVSYFKNRINLEVFHAITDGAGAINFLKELAFKYLRLAHPKLAEKLGDDLDEMTSLNHDGSYMKNYKGRQKKIYRTHRAVQIHGRRLPIDQIGVIHGIVPVQELKKAAKEKGMTINSYVVGTFVWAIYQSYLHGSPSKLPISINVPVNLRPYFNSNTNKNFFIMISAVFKPEKDDYTYEEVLEIIEESISSQLKKDTMEKIIGYNVSNETNLILRAIPLFIKKFAMRYVYYKSAKANTSTISNVGSVQVPEEYEEFIDRFTAMLSLSKGQNVKCVLCSFKDQMTLSFTSNLINSDIQRAFFSKLTEQGISVKIETNGAYYE